MEDWAPDTAMVKGADEGEGEEDEGELDVG